MLARVPFWASPFWEHSDIRRYVRYASLAVDRLIAARCLNDPCKAKAVTLACGTNFDFKIAPIACLDRDSLRSESFARQPGTRKSRRE